MAIKSKEQINPAVPTKERVLVLLDKGGKNWYLRFRRSGRYRYVSLGTPDLTEARRKAYVDPPEPNEKHSVSIRKALLAFQESRQQLIDAPGVAKGIRLNTFKTYKARVTSLIKYFQYLQACNRDSRARTVGSLKESDFNGYRNWRERQGIMLTTIKTEISQVNTILSWLYQNDFIENAITVSLPRVNTDKYRQPNRIFTPEEDQVLRQTLLRLCSSGDPERQKRWHLYRLWLEWLQDTFTRPHECRMLRFTDVIETYVDGKVAVQFSTRPETKTGVRLVYAASKAKSKLAKLYQEWRLAITPSSPLFLLPSGNPPSSSWFSNQWKQLIQECGFNVQPRELTQYSLRHQGINTLLVQGVPATKVADLAGHSLSIQQRIYKKYSLENDHSVLRDSDNFRVRTGVPMMNDADIPEPWEIDPVTGDWFPE